MERFVQFIVVGGVTLVVGLWLWAGLDPGQTGRYLAFPLVVVGAASLLYGVTEPLEL